MEPKIIWLKHSGVMLETDNIKLLVDPWKITKNIKADIILITHSHFDHLSIEDIKKTADKQTIIIAPPDCLNELKNNYRTKPVKPGDIIDLIEEKVQITAVPAYNINKEFHPKSNNWVGYIIKINEYKVYIAGDTDFIPEMNEIKVNAAILPVGGTYTMNINEAAQAVNAIKPEIAIPIHYGEITGTKEDGKEFKKLVKNCKVKVLTPLIK